MKEPRGLSRRSVLQAASAIEDARPLSGNGYKVELLRRTVIRALELAADTDTHKDQLNADLLAFAQS